MSLIDLKEKLEESLLITQWSPTEAQLNEIAIKLKEFKGKPTRTNISEIVLSIVGPYEAICLEGEDNSDLITLLLLATNTNTKND